MLELTTALPKDSQEILILQKLAYKQEAEIYGDFTIPPLTQTLEELEQDIKNLTVIKLSAKNKIIGSIRGEFRNNTCLIGRLIVHPDFQNRGLGKLLLSAMESYGKLKGFRNFELFTGEKSEKNLYLYKKMGFKEFKTEAQSSGINFVFLKK